MNNLKKKKSEIIFKISTFENYLVNLFETTTEHNILYLR